MSWFDDNAPAGGGGLDTTNPPPFLPTDPATGGPLVSTGGNPAPPVMTSGGPTPPTATGPQMPQGIDPALAAIYQNAGVTPAGRGTGFADWQYWQDVGPSQYNRLTNDIAGTGTDQPTGTPWGTGAWQNSGRNAASTTLLGMGGIMAPTRSTLSISPYAPVAPYVPPTAPAYQPIQTPTYTAPAPLAAATPYALPTEADARATPGYQFTQDEILRAGQNSAAAKGGLLTGGTLRDIQDRAANVADTYYGNRVQQGLQAYDTNEANRQNIYALNNNVGLNAFNANVNALLGVNAQNTAGTNQQFQNTYIPGLNAFSANLGQNQFGANYNLAAQGQQFGQGLAANNQAFQQGLARDYYGLGAQNQFWNQGFAENQNAFSQYNTSQNAAFNQWLQLAQLGNPGNPYA